MTSKGTYTFVLAMNSSYLLLIEVDLTPNLIVLALNLI